MKNSKLKKVLKCLSVLEVLYLLTFFAFLYAAFAPAVWVHEIALNWAMASYFILPLLLFKNVVVGITHKVRLSHDERVLTLMRCILYVLLTLYSYPILTHSY